jgi:hypothetical protein
LRNPNAHPGPDDDKFPGELSATDALSMFLKTISATALAATTLLMTASCTENARRAPAPSPPPLKTEPIGVQITRAEPRLVGTPFRVLLDFERPTDLAFVSAAPSDGAELSVAKAHTGGASLRVGLNTQIAVKLTSVVHGDFPGTWTLAGAYFCCEQSTPATVRLAYRTPSSPAPLAERAVTLSQPGRWQGVFIDLTTIRSQSTEPGLLTFRVEGGGPVYCDDVAIVNNTKVLEEPAAASPGSGWTIRQAGLATVVDRPGRFTFTLKTPEAVSDGWVCEEANAMRARFVTAGGRTWTIYAEGRQYQDGQFNAQGSTAEAAPYFARQHASPAEVLVAEEFGRVDRDTPGDKNNDGYNELRGAYQLIANSMRFEATLRPTTPALVRPVLEISRLPAGEVLATVEGRLIENSVRLGNGTLLLELPITIERPTTVNVRVK